MSEPFTSVYGIGDAMEAGDQGDRRTVLERHIQTILVAGTMALLSWVLLSVLDIRERLTKFEERIATMQAQINTGTDDRFRKSDWLREKERLDERFHALRAQVEKIDERVDKLERLNEREHGFRSGK